MIEDYIPKILDYGMAVFILWYIGNKIDTLTLKVDEMGDKLSDAINVLRVAQHP